jgi:two-component system cell cycle sensor histidine kinase/response regulator CckA
VNVLRALNFHEIEAWKRSGLYAVAMESLNTNQREDIRIIATCAGGDLTIFADRGQIEQLLMNLVTNARDAMPAGGTITIQTRSAHIDKQFIEERGYGKAGRYALLTVSDSGEGIDSETKSKIFEPFFTTKEQGKGTGLGLSMVYGIVKQNNGYIDVDSEPGRGTTFAIYLPLLEGVAAKEQIATDDLPAKGGSETILIAEDNENIRELFSNILQHYGYRVITAVDGEDAIIKFCENRDQVKLLLLDGIMPRKNGKEVYEEIRTINPSIKAIFVSGYTEDIISREGLLEQGINFVQKPVTPLALLNKVREVLDA